MAYRRYLVHKSNVQLEQSETMKSDFLANMSHEIRTGIYNGCSLPQGYGCPVFVALLTAHTANA